MALDVAVQSYPRNWLEPALGVTVPSYRLAVNLKPSTTFYRGLAIAESVATPGQYAPYNASGTDGETTPKAVCPINCSTDASGNITIGTTADPSGVTYKTIDAWFGGVFRTEDLVKASATALDATAAAALGKMVKGTLTLGLLYIR